MSRRKREIGDIAEITSAPISPGEEISHRERRYLASMAVRTICFVGAIVAAQFSMLLAAVLFLASLLLPAIAVVVANSASPRIGGRPDDPGLHLPELGGGRGGR